MLIERALYPKRNPYPGIDFRGLPLADFDEGPAGLLAVLFETFDFCCEGDHLIKLL